MAGVIPDFATEIPTNVANALQGILDDPYGRDVRQDIVTCLTWGAEYTSMVAGFINDLGLTVKDGLLCAVFDGTEDDMQGGHTEIDLGN